MPKTINISIDPQDLTCLVCLTPFGLEENFPISLNCGHTFCSECVWRLEKCAICKAQFPKRRRLLKKSILISSILQTSSQGKECAVHGKHIEGFCLREKKLVCFGCLAAKGEIVSIEEINQKVENLSEIIQETKENYQDEVENYLKIEHENFKERVENILREEISYTLLLKERVYKEIEAIMGKEKDYFRNELTKRFLLERFQTTEKMFEKWRKNQQDDDLTMEILETKLDLQVDMENFEKVLAELKRESSEKQSEYLAEIHRNQRLITCLSNKLKKAFEISPSLALDQVPVGLELQYLAEVFEACNLLAMPNTYHKNLVFQNSKKINIEPKFNPMFFDCRIKALDIIHFDLLDSVAMLSIVGQILGSIPSLESLIITLFKISELEFDLLANLFFGLKNLKEFSIRINKTNGIEALFGKLGDYLKGLQWFSRFNIQLVGDFFNVALTCKLKS